MSSWIKMGNCTHCNKPIESTIDLNTRSIVIKGCEPMLYRHAHDKTDECVVVTHHKCEPYSNWGKREEWERQQIVEAK